MGTATSRDFIRAASKRPIHCSALTAADTRFFLRAWSHFPHGPKRFARHFARRRGIPRTSRCKKEYSCPSVGTVYEVSSCATRCRYWVTVLCLPACKSSISRLFKSAVFLIILLYVHNAPTRSSPINTTQRAQQRRILETTPRIWNNYSSRV